MILVHLPGGRPDQAQAHEIRKPPGENEGAGADDMKVEAAWANPSLVGPRGLFGGFIEVRKEILDSSGKTGTADVKTQYRAWYKGKRLERQGPPLEEEVVL